MTLPIALFLALVAILLLLLLYLGTYVAYLRIFGHYPTTVRFRRMGLDSLLAGQPVEAESHFRASLATCDDPYDRVRAMVCLGDALMDQGRYEESKSFLLSALELGDPTGSAQESMADLLLTTGTDIERAIGMVEQAMELSKQRSNHVYFNREVSNNLRLATCWARKANALALLDRRTEAQLAVEQAARIAESAKNQSRQTGTPILTRIELERRRIAHGRGLAFATAHLAIGLAFLAIDDLGKAAEHFRITRDTDRQGKYRHLAQQKLEELEVRD